MDRIVDLWQLAFRKFNIQDRTNDLRDLSLNLFCHVSS